MKKLILGLLFLAFALTTIEAQSPWKEFFKPVKERQIFQTQKAIFGGSTGTWAFAPDVSIEGVGIDLKTKEIEALSGVGLGVSYGNYTTQSDGTVYCNYSINADFLSKVNIGGQTTAGLGGVIAVDVFNKFLGAFVGYRGENGFANGHILIGGKLSISL